MTTKNQNLVRCNDTRRAVPQCDCTKEQICICETILIRGCIKTQRYFVEMDFIVHAQRAQPDSTPKKNSITFVSRTRLGGTLNRCP